MSAAEQGKEDRSFLAYKEYLYFILSQTDDPFLSNKRLMKMKQDGLIKEQTVFDRLMAVVKKVRN